MTYDQAKEQLFETLLPSKGQVFTCNELRLAELLNWDVVGTIYGTMVMEIQGWAAGRLYYKVKPLGALDEESRRYQGMPMAHFWAGRTSGAIKLA